MKEKQIVIIGAGPAGLGCGYELAKTSPLPGKITIIDKNNIIGGLSRTHTYKGYRFDVGPHRFYTKNDEVLKIWRELLGDKFIKVKRLTRIFYKNKFINYPIQLKDVITKLGPIESAESLLSFLYAKLFIRKEPVTFEDWITKNFGSKLYKTFFKTYTEKVWGIPCNKIGQEWAAQRIKNLNFTEVVKKALLGKNSSKAKSLIQSFYYPTKGAGYMYEKLAQKLKNKGVKIILKSTATKVYHKNYKIYAIEYIKNGKVKMLKCTHLFSSMPLTHFIKILDPLPPNEIIKAAEKLFYRDHITVNLIINKRDLFPDNWIYIHDPSVKIARIANYNNFSSEMVANPNTSAISVEYFAFQSDKIWKLPNEELINLAKSEMEKIGLINSKDVIDGFVVRETESYPTYYLGYRKYFEILKDYSKKFKNLSLIGRAGMYKYNNMDHSIYTGMLAARNYLYGKNKYDVWSVNEDAEYLEIKK